MSDPEIKSIIDIEPEAAVEARLDAEAEADYVAGRFVPNERMRDCGCGNGWRRWLRAQEFLRLKCDACGLSGRLPQHAGFDAHMIISMN